jgi:exodeoxyribonuclease III
LIDGEAYRRLVAQGWTDALRALHPGERIYTFWDYFRKRLWPRRRLRDQQLPLDDL